MTLVPLSGPASEPLTLAEVKTWVKVTDGADDLLLQSLIVSARHAVEAATGRLLISQRWRLTLDALPPGFVLPLPLTPVRAISGVRIMNGSGAFEDVAPGLVTLDAGDDRARMVWSAPLPAPACASGGVQVDLVAGYGDLASAVPEPLRLAMRRLVAFWHAYRGDDAPAPEHLPASVIALLAPYRIRRIA